MHQRMPSILSLAVVAVALYLIIAQTENGHAREVAMWLIGFILGYWLR
jgi:hypothetical protein